MAKQTELHKVRRVNRLDDPADFPPLDRDERHRESLRREGIANAMAAAKAVEPLLKEALAER